MLTNKLIAVAADHAGFELKEKIKLHLTESGFAFNDYGTHNKDSVDYPDYADHVVKAIEQNTSDYGILICGSGTGMVIKANRSTKIRAALCYNLAITELARQHNDSNVLVLGARFIDETLAIECVNKFFTTEFAKGRHKDRVKKL